MHAGIAAATAGIELARAARIVEIVGRVSSGRTSLLLAWLVQATRAGTVVALVDADDTFDPVTAARAGVELCRVLWVRAGGRRERAVAAVDLLARCPGFGLIVLDAGELPPRLPLTGAFRWKRAMRTGDATLVVVGRRRMTGAAADLVIETVQDGCEWTGAGPRVRRLAALRTRLQLVRPQAVVHPRAGGGPWPRHARWIA